MSAKRLITQLVFTTFILVSLFFSSLGTTPVYAAGITVNTSSDAVANDGFCTLREAIATANDDSAIYSNPIPGECAVGFGADSINFAGNYTITLAGAHLPVVTSKIFITGNGAENTIIQANASPDTATYRIFSVSGSSAELVLYRLTVRHGRCSGECAINGLWGGGIYNNSGALTVVDSIISENTGGYGGGIFNYEGTLTVINSTLSRNSALYNGGGIYSGGNQTYSQGLTVMNSIIAGNNAGSNGGGIWVERGILDTVGSTISENTASYDGGGIHGFESRINLTNSTISGNSGRHGGGIYAVNVFGSFLNITNSTISENSASGGGGGIFNPAGWLTIANSTISGNDAIYGGGIYNHQDYIADGSIVRNSTISGNSATTSGGGIFHAAGFLHYANTIIANSTSGGDCVIGGGAVGVNINNLVEDGSCNALLSGDPLLGPLADNGGHTLTMALLSGSSAIDAGNDAICAGTDVNNLDQRGVTRPQGSQCDVGAFELEPNHAPADILLSVSTISENLPAGTAVGMLTTIDPDSSDTHTYSFCSGADDASFALAGNALNTAAMFNYEVQNMFHICIRSTDAGGQFIDKAFQILVQDVAENLAPETRIIKLKVKRGLYTFFFNSSATDSTFMCRLDQDAFVPCRNPTGYSGLSAGLHTFQVYAIDPSGNPDLTPAEHHFTVDQ